MRMKILAVATFVAVSLPFATAAQADSPSAEFRIALEPHGAWQHHRRWGEVWIPSHVGRDWRPYTVGHWVYSQDYGWYWAPDDQEADWGLVTYHYGRWIDDDQLGWIWIPGMEWGPGWVQWRHDRRQHVGWAPLPPDDMIVEYREVPQFWVFVRERDLVAPRITEVILPPQEREVFFRDTVVVNRTVELQDRRFGVNPGIPPTYIAAAYGRPIPSYDISPRVFAGTANLPGATIVRADDFRDRQRIREIARESTSVRRTTNTVAPARELPPLQALGANERGRLGAVPPRAAQPGFAVTRQDRPEGSNAPATPGTQHPARELPNQSAPRQQGSGPEQQPLRREGREGRPGEEPASGVARPGRGPAEGALRNDRDRRGQREGAPGVPGQAPATDAAPRTTPGAQRNEDRRDLREAQPGRDQRGPREGRTGPPSTSGAEPGERERSGPRELRSRPPEGAASPQERRDRERSGFDRQSWGNQRPEVQRGATSHPVPAAPSQTPSAEGRGSRPGVEAPRSRGPAAEGPRPRSTTGAAPGGGRAAPGGGGRREEQR